MQILDDLGWDIYEHSFHKFQRRPPTNPVTDFNRLAPSVGLVMQLVMTTENSPGRIASGTSCHGHTPNPKPAVPSPHPKHFCCFLPMPVLAVFSDAPNCKVLTTLSCESAGGLGALQTMELCVRQAAHQNAIKPLALNPTKNNSASNC